MKRLILILALAVGAAGQNAPSKVVVTDGNAPLLQALAADKHCEGLTLDAIFSHSGLVPEWALFQSVGDGRGGFQVWLESFEPAKRYTFLGSDVKRGVRRACDIINGKKQPTWMAVSQ